MVECPKGCVYIAKNVNNGKIYIGKTKRSLECRKSQHITSAKSGSSLYFHRSIMKHGATSFQWDKLFLSDNDKELLEKEKEYVKLYNSSSHGIGYNLTEGGEGGSTGSYGWIIINNLATQYEEVYSLFKWAREKYMENTEKYNKACKNGKAPMIFLIITTLSEMMGNMERSFRAIDDKKAKYHIEGYYKKTYKAAAIA